MSWYASAWAEKVRVASIYERAILTYMAHRAKKDGTEAYPSASTIADYACSDTRTVRRHIDNLLARGLIAEGNQKAAAHIRKDRRPVVYDLLIPYDWYSADQIGEVNAERAERGLGPLTPEDRPRLTTPPPAKKARSDKGVPNPKRRKSTSESSATDNAVASEDDTGGLSDTPYDPVDNSPRDVSETGREGVRGVSQTGPRGVSQTPKTVLGETLSSSSYVGESREGSETEHGQEEDEAPPQNNTPSQHEQTPAVELLREIATSPEAQHLTHASDQDKHTMVALADQALAHKISPEHICAYLLHGVDELKHQKAWIHRLRQLANGEPVPVEDPKAAKRSSLERPDLPEVTISSIRQWADEHGDRALEQLATTHRLILSSQDERTALAARGISTRNVRVRHLQIAQSA